MQLSSGLWVIEPVDLREKPEQIECKYRVQEAQHTRDRGAQKTHAGILEHCKSEAEHYYCLGVPWEAHVFAVGSTTASKTRVSRTAHGSCYTCKTEKFSIGAHRNNNNCNARWVVRSNSLAGARWLLWPMMEPEATETPLDDAADVVFVGGTVDK